MKTYIVTRENIFETEKVAEFNTEIEATKKYNELLEEYEDCKLERFEWAKHLTPNDEAHRKIYRFKVECFTVDDDDVTCDTLKESDNYYLG
jgi:hypothetical protein